IASSTIGSSSRVRSRGRAKAVIPSAARDLGSSLQKVPRFARDDIAMLKLLLSRLATAIPSIVGVVIVTFMLTRLLPGDPAAYFAGLAASPQAIAEIRTKLGLDKSLPEQFVAYVVDLAHGNLGNSLSTGQPVVAEIANRLPASAELTLVALL